MKNQSKMMILKELNFNFENYHSWRNSTLLGQPQYGLEIAWKDIKVEIIQILELVLQIK